MSPPCLVGVLNGDGRTFHARYCRSGGYPTHQLPALGEALHVHHSGDLTQLAVKVLTNNWPHHTADDAAAELADFTTRSSQRPDYERAIAGLSDHDTGNQEPGLRTGTLDESTDDVIDWLYLAGDNHISVYCAVDGSWELFGHFSVSQLRNLDQADLRSRESYARRLLRR